MSNILFDLKKIITALVLPPTGLLILIFLGLLLLKRWPRFGKWLAWSGAVLMLVLALPVTAITLSRMVSVESGLASDEARAAQAIVILAGGRMPAPEYGGATVSPATLGRIRYGAKLAKELKLPVLVTGGAVYARIPEAQLMVQALQQSFATEVRWIEGRSLDTHQNAVFSAAMLQSNGIHTVLLVTDDLHMRRSLAEFSAAGIKAVPAPVTTVSKGYPRNFVVNLPSANWLGTSAAALRELLGYLAAMLSGRT